MARVRIIGLGQRLAGNDGVGLAVLDALRTMPLPDGVELHAAEDPVALIELFDGCDHAIVVDAVVDAGEPGTVRVLVPSDLATCPGLRTSSHGFDVSEAIELARALGAGVRVELVGVAITAEVKPGDGLSEPVSQAVESAARMVLELLRLPVPPDADVGAVSRPRPTWRHPAK